MDTNTVSERLRDTKYKSSIYHRLEVQTIKNRRKMVEVMTQGLRNISSTLPNLVDISSRHAEEASLSTMKCGPEWFIKDISGPGVIF